MEESAAKPSGVEQEQVGSTSVISLHGEHDLSTGERIQAACDRAWQQGDSVVFDLTDTTFIDSSVIGVVVRARRRSQESGGSVAVVAPAGSAGARVLGLIGMGDLLAVHETRDDALRATGNLPSA